MKADCPRTILSVLASARAHRWFIRVLPMIDEKGQKDTTFNQTFSKNLILAKMTYISKSLVFSVSLCPDLVSKRERTVRGQF